MNPDRQTNRISDHFDENFKTNVRQYMEVNKDAVEMNAAEEEIWNKDTFRKTIKEFKCFKHDDRRQSGLMTV